jgi:hypothetical protein
MSESEDKVQLIMWVLILPYVIKGYIKKFEAEDVGLKKNLKN